MRVLAVADSDSYLKWTAATLRRLPAAWSRELLLIRSELLPSPGQRRAALGDHPAPVPVVGLQGLIAAVRRLDPEVIILGATGPVVELISAVPVIADRRRVLVSGLPGIAWPASPRALRARRRCDVLVVHSRREREAFARLVSDQRLDLDLALARLPYLHRDPAVPVDDHGNPRQDVILAAQALVPLQPGQRTQVLEALSAVPGPLRPVIKLRAREAEQQTHREDHPYPVLWQQLVDRDHRSAAAVTFSHEPMDAVLARARGLVTVSSSAALEAMAYGVGVIILDDFGVSPELINVVFADSGCLGSLDDLRAARFRQPEPGWLRANYFHPAAEDDLVAVIEARSQRSEARQPRQTPSWPRVARAAIRLGAPPGWQRRLRAVRSWLARR